MCFYILQKTCALGLSRSVDIKNMNTGTCFIEDNLIARTKLRFINLGDSKDKLPNSTHLLHIKFAEHAFEIIRKNTNHLLTTHSSPKM